MAIVKSVVKKPTVQGKKFFKDLARQGMLPMMGVSGRIQPSTWSRCVKCRGMLLRGVCD